MKSKWLDWTPDSKIIEKTTNHEPTRPTKPRFVGFEGTPPAHFSITPDSQSPSGGARESEQPEFQDPNSPTTAPVSEHGLLGIPAPQICPSLPKGVKLIRYEPKAPPVAIDTCSVVSDLERFIRGELIELNARLHSPVQIRAGHGVFMILDRLRQVGLELEIQSFPTADA